MSPPANELLEDLTRRGVRLSVVGDRLRWRAPKGAITPEIHAAMARHKPELLELVERQLNTTARDLVAVAEMYMLGTALDWPELPISPGVAIAAGDEAWMKFLENPPPGALGLAITAAKARVELEYPL